MGTADERDLLIVVVVDLTLLRTLRLVARGGMTKPAGGGPA
jgi:hypothetical protein